MKRDGKREKVLYLKVVLSDEQGRVRNNPYRIIAVPGALSLHNLAEVLVESFDLPFDGSYAFYSRIGPGTNAKASYESAGKGSRTAESQRVKKTKSQDLFRRGRRKMMFLFRSDIYFTVQLQREEEVPRIVVRKGEIPDLGESRS
jgi:hypothetical protein